MSDELAVLRDVRLNRDGDESERASSEPILHSSLRVLRRRKWLALSMLVAFAVPAGAFVWRRPPVYESTARLLVEPNDEMTSVMKNPANGERPTDDFLQTQQQLLGSRPTVLKTIQDVRLWDSPEFKAPISTQATDEEISRSGLVDQFLSHVRISSVQGTHLINVTFEASDPAVAKHAVNALVENYKNEQAASHGKDSSDVVGWINDRLSEQQARLSSSESGLQAYIASHDAVSVEDRQNIVVQKLSELNTALTRAKTDRMSKEALYEQLQAVRDNKMAVDSLPIVLTNPVLQQLRGQLAELQQKELRMGQELGDRHPDLIKLRSEIDLTTTRLDTELAKVTEAVKNDFVAAQAVETNLTRALDAQKREVVKLNQKSLDYGALQRQVATDRQIYERLLTESQTRGVTAKTAEHTIRVVEPAELPLAPIGPHNTRDLLFVIVAGLLLAIGAPLTIESLDHRVKTPADIETRLHLPCLAMVPQLSKHAGLKQPLMTNAASGYNEAFRRIRAAIATPSRPQVASRLLVTSASPNEGKSLVALNLAIALAKAGQRVLLLDADLRRPTVHLNFDLETSPGFANLLRRDAEGLTAIRGTSIANLFILTSGTEHSDAAELLSSPNFQSLVDVLEGRFNWIVFDSPPIGPVADACIIARLVPQTLFVVAADSTTVAAATAAIDQLKAAEAKILGVVLNRADLEHSAYYYWPYHQSQYSQYYAAQS
jgi:capsular exopolysaccharide synthesis family protein